MIRAQTDDSGSCFAEYAAYYDLLYSDKDYAAEAEYVSRLIRSVLPNARSILELGCGTGRHARLLAARGFEVHGIERSSEMLSIARTSAKQDLSSDGAGSFTCEVGDIGGLSLDRTFDAVISLFHVISYQTTDTALRAAFRAAADHVASGGPFLFDVWHGPAVLSQQPEVRTKEASNKSYRVKRTARPTLDARQKTVKIFYELECENRSTGSVAQFSEEHVMRYLFPSEVQALAEEFDLRCILAEEFLTGRPPSPATWGVTYLLAEKAA